MPDIVSDEDDEVNEANDEAEGRRRATTRAARPLSCLREDDGLCHCQRTAQAHYERTCLSVGPSLCIMCEAAILRADRHGMSEYSHGYTIRIVVIFHKPSAECGIALYRGRPRTGTGVPMRVEGLVWDWDCSPREV